MGRGGAVYLTYTAFVLLSAAAASTALESHGLWHVNIDNSPAPSRQDGPLFSAHATRNRKLLPYQIVGIVASYLGFVLIIGTLLLSVGRNLRKRAQAAASRPTEMIKPIGKFFDPSPISPVSAGEWYSSRQLPSKRSAGGSVKSGQSKPNSPEVRSVASFDQKVLEHDKQKRADEMARLYAAIMAEDEETEDAGQPTVTVAEVQHAAPPEYERGYYQGAYSMEHSGGNYSTQRIRAEEDYQSNLRSPRSPVHAIYPPNDLRNPTSYPRSSWADSEDANAPLSPAYPIQPQSPTSPNGVIRAQSTSGFGARSTPKKPRKSLRSLKISSPIQMLREDTNDEARTPLSPRAYVDPGTPPEPPTAHTMDSQYSPTTPGTATSYNLHDDYARNSNYAYAVRDLPSPNPQRPKNNNFSAQPAQSSVRPDLRPINTAPPTRFGNGSATKINDTLPLRSYANNSLAPASMNSPYRNPLSAGPTKTTFLDARRDQLTALRSGLATPYSAYMPQTPVTPVTPHLTNRVERKQRQREERALRGAITEEDAVADDKELWDSGY